MKKVLSMLAFVCSVLVAVSCAKDETVMTGTIAGLVSEYSNANQPLAGVTVTINTKGITKTTGSDGRFEFASLEPGTYVLQAQADGYQATTKQVTVYAGQTANCDFQLEKSGANVTISPLTLSFGKDVEQLSFSIANNGSQAMTYSISNTPDFVEVSPVSGTVAGKGKQAIIVSVINRAAITSARNGQMTVNVGNDSYNISISVEPYQAEVVNVDISPINLVFDKSTDQLKFTMTSNYSQDLDYTISSNLDILTVTPTSGKLAARGKAEISVTVNDRKSVAADRTGSLTISMGNNTYVVNVSVAKYEEDVTPPAPISTNRGLLAFYSFDGNNADDMTGNNYHGTLSGGTFITDTPNGKGKALSLKAKEFVNIAYNPLSDKTAQTVSMWIKDFNVGTLLKLQNDQNVYTPTFLISENMKLACYYNYTKSSVCEANTNMNSYQEGQWTMVTLVVSKTGVNGNGATGTLNFYVNGRRIDSAQKVSISSKGTAMTIGGLIMYGSQELYWNSAMKVDNVRIHGVALTDEEVAAIYNAEKQ